MPRSRAKKRSRSIPSPSHHTRIAPQPRPPDRTAAAAAATTTTTAADIESDSDSDFLLTAEEKRRKRQQQQSSPSQLLSAPSLSSSALSAAASPARPLIPGYYFDAARNKYFKLGVGHEFNAERRTEREAREAQQLNHRQKKNDDRESQRMEARKRRLTSGDDAAVERHHADYALSLSSTLHRSIQLRRVVSLPRSAMARSVFALLQPSTLCALVSRSSALSQLPVSAECGLSVIGDHATSVSVCGRVIEEEEEQRGDHERGCVVTRKSLGAYHSTFDLTVCDTDFDSVSDSDSGGSSVDDDDCKPRAPFTACLIHRHETSSLITSCHRLTTAGRSTASPMFFSSPLIASPSFMAETLLGDASQGGSFRLLHDDGHVRSACLLRDRSAFTSALHPSFVQSQPVVAIGANSAVIIFDCEREARRLLQTGKSDVLALHYSANSVIDAGQRNGKVRTIDLRLSSQHGRSAPTIKLGSSVCWLDRLTGGSDHLLLVSSTRHSLSLYDTRFVAEDSEPLVHYSSHRNECSAIRGCLINDNALVASGGDDGAVRVWETMTGRLVTAKRPSSFSLLTANASASSVDRPRAPPVIHAVSWMPSSRSLLCGSSAGLSCLTLGA